MTAARSATRPTRDPRETASRWAIAALAAATVLLVGAARAAEPTSGGGPVVLELFTSQGCSSCPPADRLLSRLATSPQWAEQVIPLAFHVDYWNYIGWTDPFSSPAWSERQRAYAQAIGSRSVYTPQLMVAGTEDCVGVEQRCIEAAIRRALDRQPDWELAVSVSADGTALEALVSARPLTGSGGAAQVLVALTESGLSTRVGAGENARHTLDNDFVVRRLERLEAAGGDGVVHLSLEPDWDPDRLAVAALVQDPGSRRILAAARAEPAAVTAAARAARR